MNTSWSLSKIWNESLDQQEKRPVEARDRMWASELGKADVDIYLKMLGTEMTNPPNPRAMRKFEAGNIWEWIMELILRRCGVYKDSQEYMRTQIDGCVEVSGKLDFIAGGKVNYEQAEALVNDFHFPSIFTRAITNVLAYFKANYPDGLDDKILEIKSVSSFGFDKVERTGQALAGHDLQLFHYLNKKQMDGAIVYIDRDSARMIHQHSKRDVLCVWQSRKPGFLSKPSLDLCVQVELAFLNGLQRHCRDVGLADAACQHSIGWFERDLVFDVRKPRGNRA